MPVSDASETELGAIPHPASTARLSHRPRDGTERAPADVAAAQRRRAGFYPSLNGTPFSWLVEIPPFAEGVRSTRFRAYPIPSAA